MKAREFRAIIERGSKAANSGYFVPVPRDVSEALGGSGQFRVVAKVDGREFRLSVSPYGAVHWLSLRAEVRAAIGKSTGDEVSVELRPDLEPREVALPIELEAALASDARTRARFEGLAYSHRKEYADYVADAKKAETRRRRARNVVETLEAEERKSGAARLPPALGAP